MICLLIHKEISVTESDRVTGRLIVGSAVTVKNWGYMPLVCGEI
jgi:hypothetical protein